MKILFLSEFDPAGVMISHRDALRRCGIDCRVALSVAYTERQRCADWVQAHMYPLDGKRFFKRIPFDEKSLAEFSSQADIIQICPGIMQPLADDSSLPFPLPVDKEYTFFEFSVLDKVKAAKVAFFHGSAYTWKHRSEYAAHYKKLGFTIVTSTLDYAVEMGATYLPPIMHDVYGSAIPRNEDIPLIVSHTPTNIKVANTDWIIKICSDFKIKLKMPEHKLTHLSAIQHKLLCNAGFDHLRGAFSVNTLEHCLLGLVPLVRLDKKYLPRLHEEGLGGVVFEQLNEPGDVHELLTKLINDISLSAELQQKSRKWALDNFNSDVISGKLLNFYSDLM